MAPDLDDTNGAELTKPALVRETAPSVSNAKSNAKGAGGEGNKSFPHPSSGILVRKLGKS